MSLLPRGGGDLLPQIRDRLIREFSFVERATHLRKGVCPGCDQKSLWTFAETPWVIRCERLNNCGYEAHAKELFPDLFESWTDRVNKREAERPTEQRNPTAVADEYLRAGRGLELALIKGTYTQESFYAAWADDGRGAGTTTVRFSLPGADMWWERLIDNPGRFGKMKARFKPGGKAGGRWWQLPGLQILPEHDGATDLDKQPPDLWIVEGVFDAISLCMHGIHAVAALSSSWYPGQSLADLAEAVAKLGEGAKRPRLVWALDSDKAGQAGTLKLVAKARAEGWVCTAAQIPQRGAKLDWNDLHLRGRLEPQHITDYLYHGALLLAEKASDKALLIHNHTGKMEFDLSHQHRLYWFKLDVEKYGKAVEQVEKDIEAGYRQPMGELAKRELAIEQAQTLQPIANCLPRALYYQRNEVTEEAWYYFRVTFPHGGPEVRGTFTAGQLSAASEFKKQLLHMAAGAIYSGSSAQLEKMMQDQLYNIKQVQTVDFIGYSRQHGAYILGDVAVKDGKWTQANDEDYFEFGRLAIKTLQRSVRLDLNTDPKAHTHEWMGHLWTAFGAKGIVALAFWLGSLFAEQVRASHMSLFFLEIVGEPGSGKTTLIQFLWKLLGRDYEGFDPSKSTSAGRMRTFTQVSNLPIVLIESDRETKTGGSAHVRSFDWDELKDAYNGRNVRTTGVKTGGNETYDPPFRASIVISQNNPVQASQAIMERICHMTFTTQGHTPESLESAKALERTEIAQVSHFALRALAKEAEAVALIDAKVPELTTWLLAQDGITKPRIAKNHAQLLAFVSALALVVPLSKEQQQAAGQLVLEMARERQRAINADHPLVQEFWESFDYLDSLGATSREGNVWETPKPVLNHSRHEGEIWVNLNEFVEKAAAHRQQIPVLSELKKVLRTSKTRRFVDVKTVNSAIRTRMHDGEEVAKTVHCWIFERPGHAAGRAAHSHH